MKFKIWVACYARGEDFNLLSNWIIWDKMKTLKVDNVVHARSAELLILSKLFSLLTVLDSDSIQLIVRMAKWHTHWQYRRVYWLPTWGQDVNGKGHKITVKVYTGLTTAVISSNFAYLSVRRGEKSRSLPQWYLFINVIFTWVNSVNWKFNIL